MSKSIPKAKRSKKEFLVCLILFLFVGAWGAHRFYVGKIGSAICRLLLTITFYCFTTCWYVLLIVNIANRTINNITGNPQFMFWFVFGIVFIVICGLAQIALFVIDLTLICTQRFTDHEGKILVHDMF